MGGFFKGWKRKVGCIALVLAAATMSAWCASLRYALWCSVVPTKSRSLEVTVFDGRLLIASSWGDFSGESAIDGDIEEEAEPSDFIDEDVGESWLYGYVSEKTKANTGEEIVGVATKVLISLWLIIIPATSGSAILLLWPSRRISCAAKGDVPPSGDATRSATR